MKHKKNVLKGLFAAALLAMATVPAMTFAADNGGMAQAKAGKMKVIFQVSDADPKKWNLTLNNAKNVQDAVGKDNVLLEIVAYGPGIGMLKFESDVGSRVKDAVDSGIKVVACENTMKAQKIARSDMLPEVAYVGAGVVELAQKQAEGYAYIRP